MTPRPAAVLLFAALPALAVHAQVALADPLREHLPGIEQIRVAIPEGAIAGHPVAVFEVRSVLPPRLALAEVERHWRARGAGTILQVRSGDWFVLSQHLRDDAPGESDAVVAREPGPAFETLQLRPRHGGGSSGLLTRWLRRSSDPQRRDEVPAQLSPLAMLLPPGVHSVRQWSSNDADRQRGTTLAGRLDDTLERAEAQVDRHLRELGFVPMTDLDDRRTLHWRDDRARFYRKDGSELLLTLHRQADGVGVVLHVMEKRR